MRRLWLGKHAMANYDFFLTQSSIRLSPTTVKINSNHIQPPSERNTYTDPRSENILFILWTRPQNAVHPCGCTRGVAPTLPDSMKSTRSHQFFWLNPNLSFQHRVSRQTFTSPHRYTGSKSSYETSTTCNRPEQALRNAASACLFRP